VAVTDVFGLQALLGREGWLDRIDIVPEPGVPLEALRVAVAEGLAGRATVRPSSHRTRFIDDSLGVLRLELQVFVRLGLLVAALLAYAAMTLSVRGRATELRVLRASGMDSGPARRGVVLESGLLAASGTALGLLLALPLARAILELFERFAIQMYRSEIPDLEAAPSTWAVGIAVGWIATLPAALAAARAATPRNTFGDSLSVARPFQRPTLAAGSGAVLLAVALIAASGMSTLEGVSRGVVALAAALGAAACSTPLWLPALRKRVAWLERALPRIGHLTGTWLAARPLGTTFATVSIAAVIGASSAVLLTIHAIRHSFVSWTELRFPDALLVSSGSSFDLRAREPLRFETVDKILSLPGIVDADQQYGRGRTLIFRGEEVAIFAQQMSTAARRRSLPVVAGEVEQIARRIGAGAIGVSDGFAHHFGVQVGEAIELITPHGPRRFEIAGIIRGYEGPTGSLFFDLGVFDALCSREGVWNLVLWTEGPRRDLIARIRERVGEDQALFFVDDEALRAGYRGWIDQFLGLLDVVVIVSSVLGGLALSTQLVGIVAEHERDLALLRAAGASRAQLAASILVEGLVVAGVGAMLGLAVGALLARPMVDFLTETYGWTLERAVEFDELGLLLLASLLIATLPALYPALHARRPLADRLPQPEA
jgi:putative ABC transport system permease protein